MKLTIERDALLRAAKAVTGSVAKSAKIPILANVALTADERGLTLLGTNTDLWAEVTVPARVEEPGQNTVPATLLLDIASNLPGGSEALFHYPEPGQFRLKCGRFNSRLPTLPAEDFPPAPPVNPQASFSVNAHALQRLFDNVAFAGDKDDTRPFSQALWLHMVNGKLRAFAGTGHLMAYDEMDAPDEAVGFGGAMIGLAMLPELSRLLTGARAEDDVALSFGEGLGQMVLGSTAITFKKWDAKAVDYARVISTEIEHSLTIDTDILEGALRRTLTSADDDKRVRMTLEGADVSLFARGLNAADASEVMAAGNIEGGDFVSTFSGDRLLTVLGLIRSEAVLFRFDKDDKRVLITRNDGTGALYLAMQPFGI